MHYDIDWGNVFHVHLHGDKEVVLFPPNQSKNLYKVPFSLTTYPEIDFSKPDYERWPKLKVAEGYKVLLKKGDVLYMPEGYWHYMKYQTAGFSMSYRSLPRNPVNLLKGAYNFFFMRHAENLFRKTIGQGWIDWKNKLALND